MPPHFLFDETIEYLKIDDILYKYTVLGNSSIVMNDSADNISADSTSADSTSTLKLAPSAVKESTPLSLEQLLRRSDVWRGRGQKIDQGSALDTGFAELNRLLTYGGWPQGGLLDIAQKNIGCEYVLTMSAIKATAEKGAYLALLNPPLPPFAVGLARVGIPLDQLLVVSSRNKSDFVASFVELSRSDACQCILSWAPEQVLSYTELRKCHLAALDKPGIYAVFRHLRFAKQSSPASLRLQIAMQEDQLHVHVQKQKGCLFGEQALLAIPEDALPLLRNSYLPAARSYTRIVTSNNTSKVAPFSVISS